MRPFKEKALDMIGSAADWPITNGMARWAIDKMMSWVGMADTATENAMKEAEKKYGSMGGKGHKDALKFARSQVGKPYSWGGVGPGGYDCSGFMSAITNIIRGKNPHSRVGATASFPWAGFTPGVAKGFTIGSTKNYGGSGVGHMAGTLNKVNVESAGGVGVRVGGSARGYRDSGFTNFAGLAKGGLVTASRFGTLARIGEGGNDELVTPLPRGWRNGELFQKRAGSDEVHLHFHGDLSFPNITEGNDAEELVKNLTLLAKD